MVPAHVPSHCRRCRSIPGYLHPGDGCAHLWASRGPRALNGIALAFLLAIAVTIPGCGKRSSSGGFRRTGGRGDTLAGAPALDRPAPMSYRFQYDDAARIALTRIDGQPDDIEISAF